MRIHIFILTTVVGVLLYISPINAATTDLNGNHKISHKLYTKNHLKKRHHYKTSTYCSQCVLWDAIPTRTNSRRLATAITSISAIYGAIGAWCYFSWYKDQNHSSFQFLNEGWFGQHTYAGGTDKLGHAYANFVMVRGTTEILMWSGLRREYAQIIASTISLTYFTGVEIKDGYGMERSHEAIASNYDYGFSWEDMIADVAGNLLAIAFIYFPILDEMFDYRLEYWPSPDYLNLLRKGDPNASEDYSGMYYALWYHLASIPRVKCVYNSPVAALKYLDIGLGYHTNGFMPKTDRNPRRELFFGVALNMQQIFDDLFFEGGTNRCVARQITRCINEVLTLPGTSLNINHTLDGYKQP